MSPFSFHRLPLALLRVDSRQPFETGDGRQEKVRAAAQVHSEEFKECVALQAQYIYDTFGKFPATVPSIFTHMFLQAHHLDLDHYDKFYQPGEYLHTHKTHMERWHGKQF